MKKIKVIVIILLMIITSVIFTRSVSAQRAYVSFQVFYDQLSPYGDWVSTPQYDYVWVPNVGPDFFPYSTDGRWIFTNYGWTWLSYYDWGWAPFHYGRWDYNNYYGWFWIPDNEWGPAWVSWRRADGYYGWEPMGPGISISMSFNRQYDNHHDHWIFVRDRDFNRSDVDRYYVNRSDNDRIIRNSTIINNTYVDDRRNTTYITGPDRDDIQRVSGQRINPIAVQEYDKPGQDLSNDNVRLYMPRVTRNSDNGQRPAPSNITRMTDVKQPQERTVIDQPSYRNNGGNTGQNRQSNPYYPQRNQYNVEPAQPGNINTNTNPTQNGRREQQNNAARQQQENVAREQQNNAARQQQENVVREQQNNAAREQQQNAAREQQNNAAREQQQNAAREQQNNAAREQQQNAAREQQQNAAREQQNNAAREQQQNAAREQQQNAAREQQNNAARQQQENAAREQQNAARQQQENAAREQQQNAAKQQQENAAKEQQQNAAKQQQENVAKEQQNNTKKEQQQNSNQQSKNKKEKQQNDVKPPKNQ